MQLSFLTTFLLNTLDLASPAANKQPVAGETLVNLSTAAYPTVQHAAFLARKLLVSESISTLSTVFPAGESHGLEGQPIGLMSYYADCSEDGSPSLLGVKLSTSFRNAAASNASIALSIRQHHPHMFSPASHPRLALMGSLSTVTDQDEMARIEKCFVDRHPDARLWLPGSRVHDSFWVQFHVRTVYWVGGFGNVAYIGFIPTDVYRSVRLSADDRRNPAREKGVWRGLLARACGRT